MKRDFLCLSDLGSGADLERVLDDSAMYERTRGRLDQPTPLRGRSVALVFDKASTRTRVSLEVAVRELGGHPLVITAQGSQMGRGEPIEDTARVLSGYVHAVTYRTFETARIVALAKHASVPVLNALTDDAHPMQLVADLYAVRQARGAVRGLRYAWVGDGNNMARSWVEAARLLGFELALACPEGFEPPKAEIDAACAAGARVRLVHEPLEAARGADVVSTDVWASMGQEQEAARRRAAFAGFCVSRALLAKASERVVVLHCLPAHRGEEIEAEVLEGPHSIVWAEAEARLHTAKALLAWAVGG
jgi:ornithine carbamoyltransferase